MKKVSTTVTYVILILAAAVMCFPVLFSLALSFSDLNDILAGDYIPNSLNLTNYINAFNTQPLLHYMINSAIVGVISTTLEIVFALLAAYAIVRSIVTYRHHLTMEKWFLLLGSAVYLLSYFQFCLEYPHICTMNVRYILLLLFTGLFFACIWGQEREADGHGAWSRALLWISGVWACVSAAMFVLLGAL